MLEAKHITKKFGGVTALSNVNLQLHPGKANAIIGENGAGKSTLMKIFSGVHTQYEGEMLLNGKVVKFANTREAEAAGIAIIHQELNLVPHLSIAENIFLGRELVNGLGVLQKKKMLEETAGLLKRLNLIVSPSTKIAELKVGQQQLVEIAKALYTNAAVIIMDEPTSAISDKEVDNLFSIITQLKAEGKTIVYISHKLKELFAIADHYIILRDGQTVDAGEMEGVTQDALIQKMTGRQLGFEKSGKSNTDAALLLTVKNLTMRHPILRVTNLLNDISFNLHKGEILGVYGLMGAGRTELMECIFGLHPRNAKAEISINNKEVKINKPAAAIAAGIALVPEDRKLHGLVLNQTIKSNISITVLKKLENWGMMLSAKKEKELTNNYINQLGIKASSNKAAAKSLSGGNQQKIVLAKWLATDPQVLLLDEPTRGIDINAKAEIYKLMKSLAAAGMGIVMVSSELPEILAVSDRVMVLCEGELTATIPIEEATEAGILKYAIHKN
ncbi:MAG: sugar ABC transporter ATP-binding protein [Lacibacter sp.]|jgi:ribose transport system ATP-binding protein|nr:sugar ABC transporter ATP-binding protein [Lacibacter sp.]